MILRTEQLNAMWLGDRWVPYKPQMYNQERLLILVGTCNIFFFAVVSFPSTSTFTDVLFDSIFVLKTGSSIETWTGITSLEKNDAVEWTWNKKISIKKKSLRSSCNQTVLPPVKSSPHNNCAITQLTNLGLYTSHLKPPNPPPSALGVTKEMRGLSLYNHSTFVPQYMRPYTKIIFFDSQTGEKAGQSLCGQCFHFCPA